MKISTGDKIRIALAPVHLLVGGGLLYQFLAGVRTPMVLVLGVGFVAFGGYRIALVRRALRERGRE